MTAEESWHAARLIPTWGINGAEELSVRDAVEARTPRSTARSHPTSCSGSARAGAGAGGPADVSPPVPQGV
ncbi:hypothetical protein V1227_24645 [Lentzea sp. DG1S-22]|uniref:hypothetical protein n=1 Tax=Lentzea sp. DG1S-22 TaxID=3108822 RepID=UPI002E7A76B2|nr:hypothetical protein [Lentzea sp. DG1S-22]WVH78264.1 hypothetical protein V1227_24645 [Lentzea sp. DG1S-22]